ncbi:MAG: tetratricopeptide repeat protein [Novosphingobium sp.]
MTIGDQIMRFLPATLALSLVAALTASAGYSAPSATMDPRAADLVAQGRAALTAGQTDQAIDAFEAALAIEPGSVAVTMDLADANRRIGLQGKALHYYREALERDPQNALAIAGEGATLVEKGAMEKAKRNLARLFTLCGNNCDATRQLTAAIAKGPPARVVTAEAVTPAPVVTTN